MKKSKKRTLVGIIVCSVIAVVFLPLLLINLTLIVKGLIDKDTPPDVFGYMPLAVLSGSMDDGSDDCIKINDMIFVKKGDPQTYVVGDIIAFQRGGEVITHRIVEVSYKGDTVNAFLTKGDANDIADGLIPVEKVYGKYEGRIGGLGGFAIFLQTPAGIAIFAGVALSAFVIFETIGYVREKRQERVADEKEVEIERLHALIEAMNDEEKKDDR